MLQQDIARLWPDWEAVRIIGRGNFGAVYEIRRDTFGHTESAALKVITIPQNESDIDDLYSDGHTTESITMRFQSYLEDIVREYNLMVDMKGHPNVVYCDDLRFIQHEDGIGWNIYIKMELLTPLVKHFTAGAPEQEVIRLGRDICSALLLCKQMKIVHRDIKPQNIFVSRTGQYKLGDFGIAKTAERTTGGTKIGTYKYMAPEVYHNRPYGSGADIYSLGLVLYWLLNDRRTPFQPTDHIPTASEEETARHRRLAGEAIPAPVHGSPELKAIVLKACAYDPKERFASAEEMLAAFEALERGAPVPAPAPAAESVPTPVVAEEPAEEPTVVPAPEAEEEDTVAAEESDAEELTEEEEEPEDAEEAEEIAAPEQEEETAQASQPEVVAPKKRKPILWIALAAMLVLCVGIGVFALRSDKIIAVSAGGYHTVGLKADGTVVAVGDNSYGQCAVGDWRDIVDISAAGRNTVGLRANGMVVAVGFNWFHQCDVGGWRNIVAISTGANRTVGLKADGTVVAVGANGYGQCDVNGWKDIVAISAGANHTVGLKADGTVVAVGFNSYGQCDVGEWRNIVAISTGEDHTVGLKADGTVVAVGYNNSHQCNVSNWEDIITISAGVSHTVGLKADGTMVAVGSNGYSQCDVDGWKDIVAISAGANHTVGLKKNGTGAAVGYNSSGQCDVDKLN